MQLRRADDVPSIFREVFDLVKGDRRSLEGEGAAYYFRGEGWNFESPGSIMPMTISPEPGLFRGYLEHESDIFNEAIRTFPQQFQNDRTTFEKLARMQHYGYKTRLLDVSPKITTALAMILQPGSKGEEHLEETGFIHVYRVKEERIKYSTGDTVTALANLARIKEDHVRLDDLSYLAYECKNERAGFHWERKGERENDRLNVSEKLDNDIGKVWCVRPVIGNPRMDFQVGEFFLWGCGDRKTKLEATFDETDYCNKDAATYGIARIGVVAISPEAKKEAKHFEVNLDIGLERIYPDFHYHSQVINERFFNHGKQS